METLSMVSGLNMNLRLISILITLMFIVVGCTKPESTFTLGELSQNYSVTRNNIVDNLTLSNLSTRISGGKLYYITGTIINESNQAVDDIIDLVLFDENDKIITI